MPAKKPVGSELAALFAEYGIDPFLESTGLLVLVLEADGALIAWNPAFDSLKRTQADRTHLKDFISSSSAAQLEKLLAEAISGRIRTRGDMDLVRGKGKGNFACLFIPLPGKRILFIAEPVSSAGDLKALTAEVQTMKQRLKRKQTELKAVLVQAHEVSHTDALTFLPNRRQIIGDLQREVMVSDRYGTPFSISMLDIDHFKNINDTYGHTVGDDVLRNLANGLRQRIRHPDMIGRYGGEEFLIILPHSPLKSAMEQAERLCKHVRSLAMKAGDQDISLTISLGLAQYKIHKEDWQTFLSRADKALYQAKNNGRDRWVIAEE
ncbi:MAG: GGDEF domain-containing protein [Chloroflexota bacterium]|nr:GGDEF domain-containing protein [Chloroflexota bacterium]